MSSDAITKQTSCLICKEFTGCIGNHVRIHKVTPKHYYDTYLKTPSEGECELCGIPVGFNKISKGYPKYCSKKCMYKNRKNMKYPSISKAHKEAIRESNRKRIVTKKTRLKISESNKKCIRKKHTEATKRKMSLSRIKILNKVGFKNKNYKYNNKKFRSAWEVKVAKWLDVNKIKWKYETKECRFKLRSGKYYMIDFYLPELNKYIEVKGWWGDHSKDKFKQAAKQLDICIVDERNINNIGLGLVEL